MRAPPDIVDAMLGLLARRAADASVCPSEVARAIEPDAWRGRMIEVRETAAALSATGQVRVTQGDVELAPGAVATAAGPIRLRRGARFAGG